MRRTQTFTNLARNDDGAAAVVVALLGVALVGMVGLAVDIGNWYALSRRTQTAADAAAVAAAFEISNKNGNSAAASAALREARKNGFTSSTACDVNVATSNAMCRIYTPPRSDSGFSGTTNAVQVILTEPAHSFFAKAFVADPDVKSNSVMQVSASNFENTSNSGGGTGFCLLALDSSATDAMYIVNNATVNCGVASNSSATGYALNIKQNAGIVGNLYTVGSAAILNNATVNGNSYASANNATYIANGGSLTGLSSTSQGPMPDPYATWEPPNSVYSQTCAETLYNNGNAFTDKNNESITLHPGRYCQGWDFGNGGSITLQSGVYVVESKLNIGNTASSKITKFNGNPSGGATIILNGNFGMSIGNNTKYYIEAPTSGDYKGIALYSRRTNAKCYSGSTTCKNAQDEITQAFANNNISHVQGVVYTPSQTIQVSNNGAVIETTACTQMIGNKVSVNNNGQVGTLWGPCNSKTSGTTDIKTATGAAHVVKTLQ
jgi:Flp pilus assembly protein TadG